MIHSIFLPSDQPDCHGEEESQNKSYANPAWFMTDMDK